MARGHNTFTRAGISGTASGVLILAAVLSPRALMGQVEDLGGQAQGIVDQMRAQASYWTPQQQQSAMGNPSVAAGAQAGPGYSPPLSPAMQRQALAAEQRIQMYQQRQQLMVAGAQAVGQIAGQMLAQALLGNPAEDAQRAEQARQAEVFRQQQIAELHQAQVNRAAQMRVDWDQRDAGVSEEISDVLSAPAPRSTAFFGLGGGVDPSAALAETAPVADAGLADSAAAAPVQGPVPLTGSSDVVVNDAPGTPALAPEFLAAEQQRAVQTAAFNDNLSNWGRVSTQGSPAAIGGSGWRDSVKDKLIAYGAGTMVAEVQGTSAYANAMKLAQYVPGADLLVKAKQAYDYGSNLVGQRDAILNPLGTKVTGTINTAFQRASDVAAGRYDADNSDLDDQVNGYQDTALSLAKKRLSTGLSYSNAQDSRVLNASLGGGAN
jgi:hypothetical protein